MKQLFTLVFGLVLTFSLVSSASAQTDALSANHWSLVEMNGEAVANSRASVEFSTDRKNVSGNAGCNRFFGGVRVSRGTMRFSGLGSTRMFCDGAMEAETAFLDAVKSVTRYRISDNVLTLIAGRTAVLKFAGSPKPEEAGESGSSASISERKWVLETAGGDPVASTDGSAFITFDADEKRAGGNTGCNVFGSSFTIAGGKITFSNPVSTMRACIEDGRMKVERSFMDALQKVDRYEINGDRLTLFGGNTALLEFVGIEKGN
ncbi:MAG: META domain-containing protein [Acidobacteria bacterium]|nr:META domain-containing protein [Acidobacteriota bacterium]